DVVYSAGPYPDPPRAIRSGNGKVYLHWHFYRDDRQCGPAGADPYILENASADADKTSALDVPRPVHVAGLSPPTSAGGDGPRRLQRLGADDAAHRAKRAALESEVAAAETSDGRRPAGGEAERGDPPPTAAPPNAADP